MELRRSGGGVALALKLSVCLHPALIHQSPRYLLTLHASMHDNHPRFSYPIDTHFETMHPVPNSPRHHDLDRRLSVLSATVNLRHAVPG
jgi:hypothetical protein